MGVKMFKVSEKVSALITSSGIKESGKEVFEKDFSKEVFSTLKSDGIIIEIKEEPKKEEPKKEDPKKEDEKKEEIKKDWKAKE